MPISIKKDSLQVKGTDGRYRSTAIFSSMLPSEAAEIVNDSLSTINNTKAAAISAINSAGSTHLNSINAAGTEKYQAIVNKGNEVLASIPQDYSDLTDLVDRTINNGFIHSTSSGDIASFSDGADDIPIKSLTAFFTSTQELHGYDHPWPGGVGKNKIKVTNSKVRSGEPFTISEITFTPELNQNGELVSITADGTASARATLILVQRINEQLASGDYIISGCPTGGSTSGYMLTSWDGTASRTLGNDTGAGTTITLDNTHTVNFAIDIKNGTQVSNLVFYPMIRLATVSDSSFESYSNICQIIGKTGLTGKRTRKNLCPHFVSCLSKGVTWDVDEDTGAIAVSGTATGTSNCFQPTGQTSATSIIYLPNGNYIISGGYNSNIYLVIIDGDNGERVNVYADPVSLTVTKGFVKARYVVLSGTTVPDGVVLYPMVRSATEQDDSFEPYTGTDISVNWKSEAGTVYNGTIDVISGKLKSIHALVELDGVTTGKKFTYTSTVTETNMYGLASPTDGDKGGYVSAYIPISKGNEMGLICNIGKYVGDYLRTYKSIVGYTVYASSEGTQYVSLRIFFPLEMGLDTIEKANAYAAELYNNGTPIQMLYKLKDPIEYQLTPQQITTLLGHNNIWINDVEVSVTYPVDTKTYIDNKIAEAIAELQNS